MLRGSSSSAAPPLPQQQQPSRLNDEGDPLRAIDAKHQQDAIDCVVNAYAPPADYFCQEPYVAAPAPPPSASFYNAMAPSEPFGRIRIDAVVFF